MHDCLKRTVRCVIVRETGERYEAKNQCDVDERPILAKGRDFEKEISCKRINMKSGEGYDACNSIHAEARAAELARGTKHIPGTAYLIGHSWACKDCQDALRAVNVHTIKFLSDD